MHYYCQYSEVCFGRWLTRHNRRLTKLAVVFKIRSGIPTRAEIIQRKPHRDLFFIIFTLVMTGPITISWKKYNPKFPHLIYRSEFEFYKSHKIFPVNFKFNYIEEFWAELLLIFLGILCLLCEKYHWYPLDGAFGVLLRCILFVAFFSLISLAISSINYIKYYSESNSNINLVKKILLDSDSYETFYSEMSQIDKRYIIEYEKLKND